MDHSTPSHPTSFHGRRTGSSQAEPTLVAATVRQDAAPDAYLIGDIAALTGLTPHALRAWERVGLLAPRRSPAGVRQYSQDDLARVRLIIRTQRSHRTSRRALATMLLSGELRPDPIDYVSGRISPVHALALEADETASLLVASEAQRAALLFDAAARVAATVVAGAPMREVLTSICREACVAFGVSDSMLWLLDTPPLPVSTSAPATQADAQEDAPALRLMAAFGPRAKSTLKTERLLRLQRGVWLAVWRTMQRTRRGVIIQPRHVITRAAPPHEPARRTDELLSLPLTAPSGVPLGALVLRETRPPGRFSESDVERAQLLAAQAAIAIENARLNEQLRTAHAQADTEQARWRAAVDHSPVLVATCDATAHITYVNPALEQLLGQVVDATLAPEHFAGQHAIVLPDGSAPFPADQLPFVRAIREQRPVHDIQMRHRTPGGVDRLTVWDCAPTRAPNGSILGAVAVGRDISTERRHRQREACLAAVQRTAVGAPDPAGFEARAGRVLDVLARSAGVPVVSASLHLLDTSTHQLRRIGVYGVNPASKAAIPLDGPYAEAGALIARPHYSDASGSPPPWYDDTQQRLWPATRIHAWATIPLRAGGDTLGALTIGLGTHHAWDEAERAWIEACADTVALALENDRLFAAARRRTEELEAVLEGVDAGITLVDASGQIVVRNTAAITLTGHPMTVGLANAESYALRDADTNAPVPLDATPVARALRGEQVRDARLIMRDGLGNDRVILSSSNPVHDSAGAVVSAVTIFRDITAQERRSSLYERLFGRLGSSLEPAAEMRVLADALVDVGAFAAAAVYGTAPDAQSLHLIVARDYPADLLPLVQRLDRSAESLASIALRTGQPQIVARWSNDVAVGLAVARQLGERMETGGVAALPLLARGAVVGVLLVTVRRPRTLAPDDIALLRELAERAALALDNARLYQAVRGTASQLDTIINAMAEAVWVCDTAGNLTVVNTAAHNLLRLSPEQVVRSLADFGRTNQPRWPNGQPMVPEDSPLSRGLRGEVSTEFEGVLRQEATGREVILQMSYAPVRDDSGAIVGAVSVGRDVTPLRELQRSRQDFLAIASHELKTPITTLLGFTQLIRRRHAQMLQQRVAHETSAQSDAWQRKEDELLARIDFQAHRLDRLVNDLLDEARIEQGRLEYRWADGDVAGAVAEAVYEQRSAHPERDILLQVPGEALMATMDADRIGQVVTNLVTNALKYSREEDPVEVSVRAEPSEGSGPPHAVVRVRDHGPGIPHEHEAHVFERFYRVPGVEVRSGSGIGLGVGLHVARSIVERHNGRIWVETPTEAQTRPGAVFAFTIPLLGQPR